MQALVEIGQDKTPVAKIKEGTRSKKLKSLFSLNGCPATCVTKTGITQPVFKL